MQLLAPLVVLLVLTGCEPSPHHGPSLVAIHATWCQACQRDKPLLAEVARELPVTDVDFDNHRAVASKYHVGVLPTYIVLSEGKEVMRTTNLRTAIQSLRSRNQR